MNTPATPTPGDSTPSTGVVPPPPRRESHASEHPAVPSTAHMWQTLPRRIPRTPHTGTKLAGVCEGIGVRYFIDPTIVRVLFVVSAFFGTGILGYILAWFLMPRWGSDTSPAGMLTRTPRTPEETNDKSTGVLLGLIIGIWVVFGSIVSIGTTSPAIGGGFLGGMLLLLLSWAVFYLLHPAIPEAMRPLFAANLWDATHSNSAASAALTASASGLATPGSSTAQADDNSNSLLNHDGTPMTDSNKPGPDNTPNPHEDNTATHTQETLELSAVSDDSTDTSSPPTEPSPTDSPVSYPAITADANPYPAGVPTTSTAATTLLKVFGWFILVASLAAAALSVAIVYGLMSNTTGYEAPSWAIAGLVGLGVALTGLALTLVCYARFREALFAAIAVIGLTFTVFALGLWMGNNPAFDERVTWDSAPSDAYWADYETNGDDHMSIDELTATEAAEHPITFVNGTLEVDATELSPLTEPVTLPITMKAGVLTIDVPAAVPTIVTCTIVKSSEPCETRYYNAGAPGEVLTMKTTLTKGVIDITDAHAQISNEMEFSYHHAVTAPNTSEAKETVTVTVTKDNTAPSSPTASEAAPAAEPAAAR
ncbi:PspC domain-containing protein [Corynebacterium aquilae]|uniref:PspC domain-containing protein n=1 Tax=Corynebacterium aquilae TaxID=203263 RepID=UPI000950EA11|nr:PspC domain-containing protein [Corynebacterium aquilae]